MVDSNIFYVHPYLGVAFSLMAVAGNGTASTDNPFPLGGQSLIEHPGVVAQEEFGELGLDAGEDDEDAASNATPSQGQFEIQEDSESERGEERGILMNKVPKSHKALQAMRMNRAQTLTWALTPMIGFMCINFVKATS